jgi:tagaturonate reductase
VSKFKVRVLPSILEYRERYGKSPKNLIFSFAQLIKFYKDGTPKDEDSVIAFMRRASVNEILTNVELWGSDLSYLTEDITALS